MRQEESSRDFSGHQQEEYGDAQLSGCRRPGESDGVVRGHVGQP